ncbi:hypothetical protein APR41_14020 [Salegentibacter salinarum]|jgi:hypothetical protein|uniref:Uncharacterized protein n=1 Tax=Salegentibacter salinarum TaxID=447422 RepID=A0A2N0U064_9FLAO|nr:hypothetical protein [Salegentibacter salinarum]PKD20391.1 hypothetical protein APR41_14020 [Salegentibacter salinarum]SKB85289.1 hypothetical protein SAMN05660903_02887 [Salegentibacter salinarum]
MKIKLILFVLAITIGLFSSCNSGNSSKTVNQEKNTVEANNDTPPETWQEHWFDHEQLLTRIHYTDDLAVYYDEDVDTTITWPKEYLDKVWVYVKNVYGDFGDDPRLYAIFHTGKYSGGHPSVYMDESHDYRNVVDCGPYDWKERKPEAGLSMVIHEIGHIVEGATNGVKENPAWEIWKDSKWAEIFIYDVYKGVGDEEFAQQTYDDMMGTYDDFPQENTQWFKDWFFPIYSNYGESEVLKSFYDLLYEHFPKKDNDKAFARRMNMGEFIHFWSGAAKTNLQAQAEKAFGWTDEWETQFKKAQSDFEDVTY